MLPSNPRYPVHKVMALPECKRDGEVVSWVVNDGKRIPLSYYGDEVIDLSPYVPNPAAAAAVIKVNRIDPRWRRSFLDVVFCYWRFGRPGSPTPKASSVIRISQHLTEFIDWLVSRDIWRFHDVTPTVFADFAHHLSSTPIMDAHPKRGGKRIVEGIQGVLWGCALPWELRGRVIDPMPVCPYADARGISGVVRHRTRLSKEAKTYCMTVAEFKQLYDWCDSELADADLAISHAQAQERLSEEYALRPHMAAIRFAQEYGVPASVARKRIGDVRSALVTQLAMLVGMRVSELMSLERDPVFKRMFGEHELHWIRSKTYKGTDHMGDGVQTEWLATPRVKWICDRLAAISDLYRTTLQAEVESLEDLVRAARSDRKKAPIAKKLNQARSSLKSILLARAPMKGVKSYATVRIIGRGMLSIWMKRAARKAGLSCPISPHVMRRSFAYMVVRYCQGDVRYLREHFKHWSIETTQLYVTHSQRDGELADEIGAALVDAKISLVESWLQNETMLAGRAGERIAKSRVKPEFSAVLRADRRALSKSLAEGLVIRATGHSWCVAAGKPPCGGVGLYDSLQCARCDGAVITKDELPVWLALRRQLQSVATVDDCGPGGRQAIVRGLESIDEIIDTLSGVAKHEQ